MLICALSSSTFCFSDFFSFSADSICAFMVSFPAVAPRSNYASALPNFSAASRSFRVALVAIVCSAQRAALGAAAGRPPCAPPSRPCGPSRGAPSPRAPGCLFCPGSLSCPGGRPRGLGISSLFKPGYFQREVLDCGIEDRDGLGVGLGLGRRHCPLLRNARAQSLLVKATKQPTRQWRGSRRVK